MPDPWLPDRRQPRDSLATKIIFFVFLSTFVTSLVVSWISVHSTYAFLHAQLETGFPALLRDAEEEFVRTARAGETTLGHLAALPAVAALAAGDETARASAEASLREHVRTAAALSAAVLRDASGRVLLRAPLEGPDPSPPADPAAPRRIRIEDGLLLLSAPVRDAEGRAIGRLEGVVAAALAPFAPGAPAAGGPRLYLLDARGGILAGPTDGGIASFPLGALAAEPGETLAEFRAPDGRRIITAQRPLALGGWTLLVAQPVEEAFAPVFSVLTRIFVIDLAVVLLFSFLAYEITSAIVRPLEALSDAARRISQGELEVEIPEPRAHDEIGLLTRTFNDMARRLRRSRAEIDQHHRQLREQNEQLQQANEVLEQLSITDGLTKLHNHRYFQEVLIREIKRVSRVGEPLSMLLIDIDDFKALNDRLGHAAGDAVLVRIARLLNESVRESDVLARYGGEEFVVLATGTELEGALFLAEKVRTAVAEASFGIGSAGDAMRVTISVGVAQYRGDRRAFFDAADRALYRAKANGKNCVVSAADLEEA